MSSIELLQKACLEIQNLLQNPVFSSVYRTKAMYVTDQDDFYNMVVCGYVTDETNPYELLKQINSIEAKYGRDRSKEIRFGPRSLDIDIEIFGDQIINNPVLTVPHLRLKERAFVLIPALEILNKSADNKKRELFKNWVDQLPDSEKNLQIVDAGEFVIWKK